jgi:hypothetical protein
MSVQGRIFLAVLFVAALGAATTQEVCAQSYSGTWGTRTDKNWTYMVTLKANGAAVTGTYVAQNGGRGQINGTVNGGVLQFKWTQDGGFAGTGQFALAADGNSFSGTYQADPHDQLSLEYRNGFWVGFRKRAGVCHGMELAVSLAKCQIDYDFCNRQAYTLPRATRGSVVLAALLQGCAQGKNKCDACG